MQWSVSIQASGDRELTREEIVELADAVAPAGGVVPHKPSTRKFWETTWLARNANMASTARCFVPPSRSGPAAD